MSQRECECSVVWRHQGTQEIWHFDTDDLESGAYKTEEPHHIQVVEKCAPCRDREQLLRDGHFLIKADSAWFESQEWLQRREEWLARAKALGVSEAQ